MKSGLWNKISIILQDNWAFILAVLVFLIASRIAVLYAMQPLLEQHSFRQTQTALTSYWMIQDGWKLAYETPVGGYPWTIPCEFPIYQSILALLSVWFHFPLDATGRLVSFCFLLACAWPARMITHRLLLKKEVAWIFCALLWSSPLYLFWGRTFMIETAAVFFTLTALAYGIDLIESTPPWKSTILFTIFASLGILQKVTTTAPILVVLAFAIILNHLKTFGFKFPSWSKIVCVAISFIIPFALAMLWTIYTDHVKSQSAFGALLTSKSLAKWNFGTLSQRLDVITIAGFFWNRVIKYNAAGFWGMAILCYSLFFSEHRIKMILIISLLMFGFPVFIFTNLHLMHNYYQVSSALFLLMALSIATVIVLPDLLKNKHIFKFIILLFICNNLYNYHISYGMLTQKVFNVSNSRTLAIADIIRKYTPGNSGLVVFGENWSSEIAYYSNRKSFMVPSEFSEFDSVWKFPTNYIGNLKLGAVIFFAEDNKITKTAIMARTDIKSDSCLYKIDQDCFIWLPGVKSTTLQNVFSKID